MQSWTMVLRRLEPPVPGRPRFEPEGTKLRQLLAAVTGWHNEAEGAHSDWPPVRIQSFRMADHDRDGSLVLTWLPPGAPPLLAGPGSMFPVGPSVLGVADVQVGPLLSLTDLLTATVPVGDIDMRSRSPLRLRRQVEGRSVDVVVPREDAIFPWLGREWNKIAELTQQSTIGDATVSALLAQCSVVRCTNICTTEYVVKRDGSRRYTRTGFTGAWKLRLPQNEELRRWAWALLQLSTFTGLGADLPLGNGQIHVAGVEHRAAAEVRY